jgi:simple sugar transport system ATP-binding protein
MVGRDVTLTVSKDSGRPGEAVLAVSELVVRDERGHQAVDEVSLQVRAGEILAIAGVQGNGQEELVQALVGLRPVTSGSIVLDGVQVAGHTPRQILDAGVGYIPEDRQHDGIVGSFSVTENLVLDRYCRPPFSRGHRLLATELERNAVGRIAEFDIRAAGPSVPAQTLSGGNQQKIVIAREMSRPLRLLIASQPTRGLDVGAQEFIHRRIVDERDNGAAVVIVSTELDEVMNLADRIVVMYRGRVVGELPGDVARDTIGLMMAGIPAQSEVPA